MRLILFPALIFLFVFAADSYSAPADSLTLPVTRLRNDDPAYNKKYPWYIPALEQEGLNTLSTLDNRYILKVDYGYVSLHQWITNIEHPAPVLDDDPFSGNFFTHPYGGSVHFNFARSNGYNFYESAIFTAAGTTIWEYFHEATPANTEDLLNQTFSGIFAGEINYRLSSCILDDRTHGTERVFRELGAGIVDPGRFLNRLFQGRLWRISDHEIYQKEPLDITIDAGAHLVGGKAVFGAGTMSEMMDFQFDYGDPFEVRDRKPFDYFKVRGGVNFGSASRFADDITGHGLIYGKNIIPGKDSDDLRMLAGFFQYSDFWENKTFELGAIGLGAGVVAKLPLTERGDLTGSFHLAAVPLAGTSYRGIKNAPPGRDYEYGGGAEARLETILTFDWLRASFIGYFFVVANYTTLPIMTPNFPGTELVGILKPNITVQVAGPVRLGFEYRLYYNDLFPKDFESYHAKATEERIFVELFFPGLNRE